MECPAVRDRPAEAEVMARGPAPESGGLRPDRDWADLPEPADRASVPAKSGQLALWERQGSVRGRRSVRAVSFDRSAYCLSPFYKYRERYYLSIRPNTVFFNTERSGTQIVNQRTIWADASAEHSAN